MWIKCNADLSSGINEPKNVHPVMINTDHVKKISPGDKERGTKIVFADGEVVRVTETYTKLEAEIDGSIMRAYKHEPPKE